MKKNNKGFFLAETIVVIALVTTVMAFVYPNVTKLYDNYKNRTKYYDQTEDLYLLLAYSELYFEQIQNATTGVSSGCTENEIGGKRIDNTNTTSGKIDITPTSKIGNLKKLYITSYMTGAGDNNYNFNKYLKRMKKTTNDTASYRLIGMFDHCEEGYKLNKKTYKCDKAGAASVEPYEAYASIKIDNPNPNRNCNLGGE